MQNEKDDSGDISASPVAPFGTTNFASPQTTRVMAMDKSDTDSTKVDKLIVTEDGDDTESLDTSAPLSAASSAVLTENEPTITSSSMVTSTVTHEAVVISKDNGVVIEESVQTESVVVAEETASRPIESKEPRIYEIIEDVTPKEATPKPPMVMATRPDLFAPVAPAPRSVSVKPVPQPIPRHNIDSPGPYKPWTGSTRTSNTPPFLYRSLANGDSANTRKAVVVRKPYGVRQVADGENDREEPFYASQPDPSQSAYVPEDVDMDTGTFDSSQQRENGDNESQQEASTSRDVQMEDVQVEDSQETQDTQETQMDPPLASQSMEKTKEPSQSIEQPKESALSEKVSGNVATATSTSEKTSDTSSSSHNSATTDSLSAETHIGQKVSTTAKEDKTNDIPLSTTPAQAISASPRTERPKSDTKDNAVHKADENKADNKSEEKVASTADKAPTSLPAKRPLTPEERVAQNQERIDLIKREMRRRQAAREAKEAAAKKEAAERLARRQREAAEKEAAEKQAREAREKEAREAREKEAREAKKKEAEERAQREEAEEQAREAEKRTRADAKRAAEAELRAQKAEERARKAEEERAEMERAREEEEARAEEELAEERRAHKKSKKNSRKSDPEPEEEEDDDLVPEVAPPALDAESEVVVLSSGDENDDEDDEATYVDASDAWNGEDEDEDEEEEEEPEQQVYEDLYDSDGELIETDENGVPLDPRYGIDFTVLQQTERYRQNMEAHDRWLRSGLALGDFLAIERRGVIEETDEEMEEDDGDDDEDEDDNGDEDDEDGDEGQGEVNGGQEHEDEEHEDEEEEGEEGEEEEVEEDAGSEYVEHGEQSQEQDNFCDFSKLVKTRRYRTNMEEQGYVLSGDGQILGKRGRDFPIDFPTGGLSAEERFAQESQGGRGARAGGRRSRRQGTSNEGASSPRSVSRGRSRTRAAKKKSPKKRSKADAKETLYISSSDDEGALSMSEEFPAINPDEDEEDQLKQYKRARIDDPKGLSDEESD